MSNSIVIQTSSTVIEDMKQQYKHSLSPKTPQGRIFMAKCHRAPLQRINPEK